MKFAWVELKDGDNNDYLKDNLDLFNLNSKDEDYLKDNDHNCNSQYYDHTTYDDLHLSEVTLGWLLKW